MEKSNKNQGFSELITRNIVWIITTLISIGAGTAIFKQQSESLANNVSQTNLIANKVHQLELNFIKFESMRDDIRDIKSEIREIKRIVLKPAVGENSYGGTNLNDRKKI